MVGRDTVQAEMAAAYLAEHRADRRIAILHDGQAFGQGLAEVTKAELNRRGVTEALYGQMTPGGADYLDTLAELKAAGIDVLFYGGYQREAALLIRQARDHGYDLQMIGGDALLHEDFWHVAGPAAVGVRFVSVADPRTNEGAAPVIEKFRAEGYEPKGFTLYAYAAVEVWAQAVEKAGTVSPRRSPKRCTAISSTPCSAGSASTRRATSRLRALRVVCLAEWRLRAARPGQADRLKPAEWLPLPFRASPQHDPEYGLDRNLCGCVSSRSAGQRADLRDGQTSIR